MNREIARFSDGKNIRFVDINGKIADASGKFLGGMVNPDKLHPTGETHQIWADAVKPILAEILGPPATTDLGASAHGRSEGRIKEKKYEKRF